MKSSPLVPCSLSPCDCVACSKRVPSRKCDCEVELHVRLCQPLVHRRLRGQHVQRSVDFLRNFPVRLENQRSEHLTSSCCVVEVLQSLLRPPFVGGPHVCL